MALSFLTYNTNGCSDPEKIQEIVQFVQSSKVDIALLSEAHCTFKTEKFWNLHWEGQCLFSHGTSNSGGLVVLLSKNVKSTKTVSKSILQGRCMYVNLEINNFPIHVFNIHAPTVGEERITFLNKLHTHLSAIDKNELIIVGGDFNSTLNPQLDRKSQKETHVPSSNVLQNLVTNHNLVDIWREHHSDQTQYTWFKDFTNAHSSAARLDRFYISNQFIDLTRNARILPKYRSDHCPVTFYIQLFSSKSSSHWCLNNSILSEENYINEITEFWNLWKTNKYNFQSPTMWWDIGKVHIKSITKEYCTYRTSRIRQYESNLLQDIRNLEGVRQPDEATSATLSEKRKELEHLTTQKVRGACIRTRFNMQNHLDSPTKFFFNLEKKEGCRRTLSFLENDQGAVTTDPTEIHDITKDFYKNLYTKSPTSTKAQEKLHAGLPTLSAEAKDFLESDLTFEEFSDVIKNSPQNKTPGIDGLSFEFYKTFWKTIGPDLFDVFKFSTENGALPKSCTRSIITLLPKTGNLGLIKNWRPVSLLCTDYKIFTKVLSNRLRRTLEQIIHPNQTYTVPTRTIYNNISLLRDTINVANTNNLPLGIVSLDQEKAFDRVDHQWLFRTLSAFGFGENFISHIKLMYKTPECLLKINHELTTPFRFSRGIRQGCPLSGSLYAICIEPLLHFIRKNPKISGFSADNKRYNKLSGYADDVDIFITKNLEFQELIYCVKMYEKASSAKINLIKSKGLWCGSWRHRTDSPLGFTWTNVGLKFLGVCLGNTAEFELQNWEDTLKNVKSKINIWKPLFPFISLKGRILIINCLTASKLWHKMQILSPPKTIVKAIEKFFIDSLWNNKKHWVRPEILFLHPDDGGLGLVDINAKIQAFRLTFLKQAFCDKSSHPAYRLAKYIFRQVQDLSYDQQWLICKQSAQPSRNNDKLFDFFTECMTALRNVQLDIDIKDLSVLSILHQPLFNNSLAPLLDNNPNNSLLAKAGITKIGHLLNEERNFKSADDLSHLVPNNSKRILSKEIRAVQQAIPKAWLKSISEPQTGDESDLASKILVIDPCTDSNSLYFNSLLTKQFYFLICRRQYAILNVQFPGYKWKDILLSDNYPRFHAIYSYPIPKAYGDIQWRIMHGAVANQMFRYNAGFTNSPKCLFCDGLDDLKHTFIECPSNNRLAALVKHILQELNPNYVFNVEDYIYLLEPSSTVRKQINLIFTLSKFATYKALSNKSYGIGQLSSVEIFRKHLNDIIKTDFDYYAMIDDLDTFSVFWCDSLALCKLDEDDSLVFIM